MRCHLNIGSNIGDSRRLIESAIRLIESRIAVSDSMRVSKPYVSEAWGYESPHRFTNVGVSLLTELSPTELLARIQSIEQMLGATAHRNADGSYCDRNLDIDIIHLGDLVLNTPGLTVPHPRMHLRDFVLIPLAELEPDWKENIPQSELIRGQQDN
ncbi:MAG: 2-amino-4-hydroxy-6-hydroxymethyldihydropteridine diphosphokinase [Muribaculaceae bacterium]|nr:2-amino-4-hydroxy-6-hydroxymethyldihydropteridine diphosphokinase [Muribaculaceae bacterium]